MLSSTIQKFQDSFDPISLEALNKKAKMMERNEKKYIFSQENLSEVLPDLLEKFEILEIQEKRNFEYETIYFDEKNNTCYTHHHQKKRQRFKARTRRYVDSDLYFFEFKLKDIRNKTSKKRYKCSEKEHGKITKKSYDLMKGNYKDMYKKEFLYDLTPSNKMSYKRITLVAKAGNERLTIDYNLTFFLPEKNISKQVPDDFIIIETKSLTGNGIADKIFKIYKHRNLSCSKFCLAKIYLHQVEKHNSFRPMLKKYLPELLQK